MKKQMAVLLMAAALAVTAGAVPSAAAESSAVSAEELPGVLEDGIYEALFSTDSSMFHANEATKGRCVLTVRDGKMTIHVPLASKKITELFSGFKADAESEGAELLEPTVDSVTYEDGTTEDVFAFDIPVPALDEEFPLAIIGEKGKWYDHMVSVSDPVPADDDILESVVTAAMSDVSGAEIPDAAEPVSGAETADAAEPVSGAESMAEEASYEDLEKAGEAAALIDAIYVQEYTDETEEQCAAAKAAWDALTDEQKELVEGEFADPDYFGRDTGDASLDDPRNADDIGENELLVVSFGTSFNDSRAADIGGIEEALAEAYPDWSVRRAFTAQIIINHILARDGEKIDNVRQALERAAANGVKNLVVQPTHLMHGAEYDEMCGEIEEFAGEFESVKIAEPLLGEVGADASEVNDDKKAVAEILTADACRTAGYDNAEAAAEDGTAFVFMGHGTSHSASVTYNQMQAQMEELGYGNVFIGTVEGEPEDTACDAVIEKAAEAGFTKIILRPLMVVAGDHANNDMAGEEEDSWFSMFSDSGAFEAVECQIAGLGRIEGIEEIYAEHAGAEING